MKRSAGILLFRVRERRLTVLLVHPGGPLWSRKDLGAWSIPKGEHTEAEDPRTAAAREFAEETGVTLTPTGFIDLGETTLKSRKRVAAWAVEGDFDVADLRSNFFEMTWPPRSGRTRSFPEVDRAEWFDPDTARDKLNPGQVVFLDRLETTLRAEGRLES